MCESQEEYEEFISYKLFQSTGIEYRLRVLVSQSKTQLTEEDKIYEIICKFATHNATVSAAHDTMYIYFLLILSTLVVFE